MKIQITAGGIYGAEGEIPIGTEFDLDEAPKGWEGRYTVLGGGKTTQTGEAVLKGPFEAKEKSAGWYAIHDASGAEVGKALRKDDADAFNDLSDDDKAAFAAEHAKA